MLRFVLRRLALVIPVLWVTATTTFFMIRLAPGGPFSSEKALPPEILANIEAKYHLNDPLWRQYLSYMGDLLRGDLGPSFRYASMSVNQILAESLPPSFILGLVAMGIALATGVVSGVVAANRRNRWPDYAATSLSLLGVSLPTFVIGPVLALVFGLELGWFPTSGWNGPMDVVLPAATLAIMYAAYFARLTRAGVLDVLRQDFIRTAHAKGLRRSTVLLRHALRGGVLPAVSFMGPAFASLVTGSLVVETVFDVPGVGRLFVQSALNRDYTLVMGTVLVLAVIIILSNLAVDVLQAYLDPRVSYE